MGEVDPAFIQPQEHRPKPDITRAEGIPLIDLSTISSPNSTLDNDQALGVLVDEIGDACKSWGVFFRTQLLSLLHISLPMRNSPGGLISGPEYPADLREVCEEYAKEIEKLAYKLMGLIALSLGLPEDRFHGFFEEQTSFIRLNHYPPCPVPDLALGVGRHKDAFALTILAQDDVGGLEVKRKTDGEWLWVKPTPNAYIINVGDIIQVWSNDTYESVEHRAMVNSGRERFSIPYFLGPAHYTNVQPLEELVNQQNPAKYKPYNWGKFLVTRKRSNFQKLDVENIQIHHFKIPESEMAEKLD
ncbi:DIRIGENT PROTEIN [Salix koriyanagi]|uniref:DIRIGENT PROTEIN n=1 Tax=Salix koriyanagi TaxID=2511006 RepID=A0A9Q0Z0F0_9ROSI|nr:DIRIGENT PROTEIN [Salix koriyanagi]